MRRALPLALLAAALASGCRPAPRVLGRGSAAGMELVVTQRLAGELTLWARADGMTLAWPFAPPGARRHVAAARVAATAGEVVVAGEDGKGGWVEMLRVPRATMRAGAAPPTLVTCALESGGEIPLAVPESDPERLALLGRALASPVPAIREAASLAVARMGKAAKPVRMTILDAMTDPDPGVREAAKQAALELDRPDPKAHSCHAAIRKAAAKSGASS